MTLLNTKSHATFVLLNAPYVLAIGWIAHTFPALLTPTVVINLVLLSFTQACLVMHGITPFMRGGLLYLFILGLVFFVLVLASHFICGTDIFKLIRVFFQSERKIQQQQQQHLPLEKNSFPLDETAEGNV